MSTSAYVVHMKCQARKALRDDIKYAAIKDNLMTENVQNVDFSCKKWTRFQIEKQSYG